MTPVFGHDDARARLFAAAAEGRLHHAWILAGPHGIGKASLARSIALSLLAGEDGPVADDHPQAHLFAAGTHPDYAELARLERENGDLARNISVDQIRGLSRLLSSAPSVSHRRIILIDSADDLERSAANALLKNLEEPPRDTLFLLVSHAPARLLPTIRSRCRMLRLKPLDEAAMRAALARAAEGTTAAERDELVALGEGSPGRALALGGLGVADMLRSLARIADDGDPNNSERLALAKSLSPKSARPRYEAFLDVVPSFILSRARGLSGDRLARAIRAWEEARDLGGRAILVTLDPAATVFELCSHVAALAEDAVAA